jgi:hypothetical protein
VIAALAGSDEATRTLRGKPLACELDVPATRDVVSDKGHHILAIGDGAGLTVDSKQENLLDPSAVLKEAKEMAAKQDPNAKMTEAVPITIDGHKWLQFTTITTLEGNALTVLKYTYSGPEGTFVVTGWTSADQFETKRALLTHYMNTFRFPKEANA